MNYFQQQDKWAIIILFKFFVQTELILVKLAAFGEVI